MGHRTLQILVAQPTVKRCGSQALLQTRSQTFLVLTMVVAAQTQTVVLAAAVSVCLSRTRTRCIQIGQQW